MSLELNDNYHIWKIKLQLAQEGNSQALQDIKSHCFSANQNFPFIENNFHDTILNSQIRLIDTALTYGNYEMYYETPIFLLLQGSIQLKCLNLQGDQQTILKTQDKGIVFLTKEHVVQKFGQANLNIVTKFHCFFPQNSIFIEINQESRRKVQSPSKQAPSLVGLREQSIMKKYMLFPLKYIRIELYEPKVNKYEQKMYLLQGRACYFFQKGKQRHLLAVYEEGYLNPKQFENSDIHLYIFQNSKLLIFQQEFMRDDVIGGVQSKRSEHIKMLIKAYQKLSAQQKKKIQVKLINSYKLNKKEVEIKVLGITQAASTQKQQSSKRISTKNDLISTSSSIKEKCKIRISKRKKLV